MKKTQTVLVSEQRKCVKCNGIVPPKRLPSEYCSQKCFLQFQYRYYPKREDKKPSQKQNWPRWIQKVKQESRKQEKISKRKERQELNRLKQEHKTETAWQRAYVQHFKRKEIENKRCFVCMTLLPAARRIRAGKTCSTTCSEKMRKRRQAARNDMQSKRKRSAKESKDELEWRVSWIHWMVADNDCKASRTTITRKIACRILSPSLTCNMCGSDHPCMTIDHKHGDGHVQRKSGKHTNSERIYREIVNGHTAPFQLLCGACNLLKSTMTDTEFRATYPDLIGRYGTNSTRLDCKKKRAIEVDN